MVFHEKNLGKNNSSNSDSETVRNDIAKGKISSDNSLLNVQKKKQRGRKIKYTTRHYQRGTEHIHFKPYIYKLFKSLNNSDKQSQRKTVSFANKVKSQSKPGNDVTKITKSSVLVLSSIVKDLIQRFAFESNGLLAGSFSRNLDEPQAFITIQLIFHGNKSLCSDLKQSYEHQLAQLKGTNVKPRKLRKIKGKMKGKVKTITTHDSPQSKFHQEKTITISSSTSR